MNVEFQKAMKILHRMCADKKIPCGECPLSSMNNGRELSCFDLMHRHAYDFEIILAKWAEEHPEKTMLQDFIAKYPNAKRGSDGTPNRICPDELGYCQETERCCIGIADNFDCVACWNRPVEVEL